MIAEHAHAQWGLERAHRYVCAVSGGLMRVELAHNLSVLQQLRDSVADSGQEIKIQYNIPYFCLWIRAHCGERKQWYPRTQLRFLRISISLSWNIQGLIAIYGGQCWEVQAAVGRHKAAVGQQELLFSCGWLLQLSHSRPKLLNSLLSLRKVNSEINWTMLGVVLVMIVDEL